MKGLVGALLLVTILASCAALWPADPLTAELPAVDRPPTSEPGTAPGEATPPAAAGGVLPSPAVESRPDDEARLADTDAPLRNQVALAEAFGRCAVPCLRVSSAAPQDMTPGSRTDFSLIDFARNERYTVTAELRYSGPIVLMYVEEGQDVDQRALTAAAQRFEAELYPRLQQLFGSEAQPGVDGDRRITVLNARDRTGSVLGYFSADDSLPRSVAPFSNQREMFVQNIAQLNPASDQYLAVLVHEFQHLIHQSQQPGAATWWNEALSQLAVDLTGFADDGLILTYLNRTDTGLTDWGHAPGASLAHYGASHLFLRYLRGHYLGEDDLLPLMRADAGHRPQLLADLAQRRRPHIRDFADLVGDWAVANLVDNVEVADGRYSYHADSLVQQPLPRRAVPRDVTADWSESIAQFGVDYLALPRGSRLSFAGQPTVGLAAVLPADAAAWYALRGDERSVTLTRSIDLRGVSRATLEVTLWYELETDYDFAYVTVSTDGGRSWQPLRNAYTHDAEALSHHFDGALNGVSGDVQARPGDGTRAEWQLQRFDLSAFAGQEIELRFWVVTDEAINSAGLLIDRVAIPETGYVDEMQQDGDWRAEGFARVSGELVQQWRLFLVEQRDGPLEVLPLAVDSSGKVDVALDPARDYTLVVVAGTAYTTEPAEYRLRVDR